MRFFATILLQNSLKPSLGCHAGKFCPKMLHIFFPPKMKVQILLFCFCYHICHENAHFVLKFHGPISNSYLLILFFQFFSIFCTKNCRAVWSKTSLLLETRAWNCHEWSIMSQKVLCYLQFFLEFYETRDSKKRNFINLLHKGRSSKVKIAIFKSWKKYFLMN